MLSAHMYIQAIAVRETESGVQLITRKKGASPHAVRPAFATTTIRPRSGGRRAAGVTASLAKRGYRPDLRAVSVPCPPPDSPHSSFDVFCSLLQLLLLSHRLLLDMHHLEPAGPPQGNTKVGCGHDVQDCMVWVETDQIFTRHAPCRYRVPFDAPRGLPDSLALTFVSLLLLCLSFLA